MRSPAAAALFALAACSPAAPTLPASNALAPSAAPSAPAPSRPLAASRARIERDIHFIARPRPPGSAHHAAVRELCSERFESLGYTVTREQFDAGINIIATAPGERPDQVLVSAHYDHIAGCSGADDNASGVAAVLEAAHLLAGSRYERTLVFACWDAEEDGLLGSDHHARSAAALDEQIDVAFSLDGVGVSYDAPLTQRMPPGFDVLFPAIADALDRDGHRGNFLAVIGDSAAEAAVLAFARRAAEVELPVHAAAVGWLERLAISDLQRSDHASFWLAGFPAVLLSDSANFRYGGYHCDQFDDAPHQLNYDFVTRVADAMARASTDLLGKPLENRHRPARAMLEQGSAGKAGSAGKEG